MSYHTVFFVLVAFLKLRYRRQIIFVKLFGRSEGWRGSGRFSLIFFSPWRKLEDQFHVRKEDLPVLIPPKSGPLRTIIRNIPFHSSANFTMHWSNGVMLFDVTFVHNWQKLNKQQKKMVNGYLFSSDSAHAYDYIIFEI